MKFKCKIFLLFLFITYFISCGATTVIITPVELNLETKYKLFLSKFNVVNKNFFEFDETYDYLSDYLGNKLNEWLIETNGFDISHSNDDIYNIEFDPYNLSNIKINDELLNHAIETNTDIILFPFYKIDTTIDSTSTDKILNIRIYIVSYNVKANEFRYNNAFTTIAGLDLSEFEGPKSLIKYDEEANETNEESKTEEEMKQQELTIAEKILTTFDNTIAEIANDYAIFVQNDGEVFFPPEEETTDEDEDENNNNNSNENENENNSSNNDNNTDNNSNEDEDNSDNDNNNEGEDEDNNNNSNNENNGG